MAETIGRAYIKILADGSGFPEALRKELRKADAVADTEGDRFGQKYGESFKKGFGKTQKDFGEDITNAFEGAVKDSQLAKTFFAGAEWKRFTAKLRKESGKAGQLAGADLEHQFRHNLGGLENAIKNMGPRLDAARARIRAGVLADEAAHQKQLTDLHIEALKINAALDAQQNADNEQRFRLHIQRLAKIADERADFEKEWRAEFEKTTRIIHKSTTTIESDMDKMAETIDRTRAVGHQSVVEMGRDWVRTSETIQREAAKTRKALEDTGRASRGFLATMDAVGLAVGKTFGKGSRNDFLNFFGSLLGNLAQLPGLLGKAVIGFGNFALSVGDAFVGARNPLLGFIAATGKIAPAIGGAGLGIIALGALVSTLATALLLAAGAAAALASSLTFGLIGAIAPLVGVLGPLSLVVAGLGTAFIGMSEKAKEATKEAFEPLKDQLKELGNAARPGILDGITAAAENLEEPLKRLKPLFKVVGDSVGTFIDTVSKVSFGPGFDRFAEVMTKTMPDSMKTLGTIVGNVFDGLAGLFATLEPVTTRFLIAVEGITAEFAKWSISPDAERFFQKAAGSADALLDFLGPIWDLTKQIVDAGRKPGNELFRDMGRAVQGWVDAINADPNILRDFFEDAKRMGEEIGNVVLAFGHLIDAMDTPTTRDWAIKAIELVGDLINLIADLIGWFTDLDGTTQGLIVTILAVGTAWGVVATAIRIATTASQTFGGTIGASTSKMSAFGGTVKTVAGAAGLGLLANSLHDTWTEGANFGDTLGAVAGGAGIGLMFGPVGALVGALAGGGASALAGAFGATSDKAEEARLELLKGEGFAQAKSDAAELAEALVGVINAYGDVSRAQIEASFWEEGKLDEDIAKLRELGFSMDTIVSGALGNPEAVGLVLGRLGEESALATKHVDDLSAKLKDAGDGVLLLEDEFGHLSTREVQPGEIDKWEKELAAALTTQTDLTAAAAAFEDRIRENGSTIEEHSALVLALRTQLGLTAKEYNSLSKPVRMDIEARGLPETFAGVERLLNEYKGLRNIKSIQAFISAPGVDLTVKDIEGLANKYKNLRNFKSIKTLIKTEGIELSDRQIRRIINRAKEADKQESEIDIKVNRKPADDAFEGVDKSRRNLDGKTAEPKIGADDKEFTRKNKNTTDELDKQGRRTVTPMIKADNSQALTAITAVNTALNNIQDEMVTVTVHTVHTSDGKKAGASGGIFGYPTTMLIGEAGPEALVPLNRPLAMVDPAVRELSAIAQGLRFATAQRPDQNAPSKRIDVGGITIITPTKDPGAVAQEVVNRLVPVGY